METSHFELPGKPSESVTHSETRNTAVWLNIQQGLCFSINPVGSRIWKMMQEEQSFNGIVGNLAGSFDMSRRQICTDVMEFATMLHKHGLLLTGAERGASRVGAARNAPCSFRKMRAGWRLSKRATAKNFQDMR